MAEAVSRATGRRVAAQGDVTAMQATALEEQRDAAAADAADLKFVQNETEAHAKRHRIIDYTDADAPLPEVREAEDAEDPYRVVIMKYSIEKMAFGREIVKQAQYDEAGNITVLPVLGNIRFFDFEEGRRYRLPRPLADHLDERGYVYH